MWWRKCNEVEENVLKWSVGVRGKGRLVVVVVVEWLRETLKEGGVKEHKVKAIKKITTIVNPDRS